MAGDDDITVDLEGKALDPRAVADAITQVENLVTSLDADNQATLTLTAIRGGSAHITMAVVGTSLDTLANGLEALRTDPVLPSGWARDSLLAVSGLGKVTNIRGVDTISLRIANTVSMIDSALQRNAEKALEPSSRSLGSIRGNLYRYTNDIAKNRRSAGLRNVATRESVELRFSAEVAPTVREHLEKEVEVWGEVARDSTGKIVYITIDGITPIEYTPTTTASDGRGLLGSDWTGGIDPVEWVRTQRG